MAVGGDQGVGDGLTRCFVSDGAGDLPGGGVEHILGATGGAFATLAVDEVMDGVGGHGRYLYKKSLSDQRMVTRLPRRTG